MTGPAFERDGQAISREAFYAIACDPRRHVAVEACAGAGKTWMLVSRILRALLDGAAPHEILAITFTKKAAGEMRARLIEWLETFAKASPEVLVQELLIRGVPPEQAQSLQAPLRALYGEVLASGRSVQIRTFHSWFAALLRAAPMAVLQRLGLPTQYELLEDDAQAVDLVWRRFYSALLSDPAARADFESVILTHGRSNTDKALTAALARRIEFALADEHGHVLSSVPPFAEVFADLAGWSSPEEALFQATGIRSSLNQTAIVLGQAAQKTFSAKGGELEKALTEGDAKGVIASLFTGEMQPRKFNEKVVGIAQVRESQAMVQRVMDAQTQHEAWLYQQRMTRLSRVLIHTFAELKRERGWVDMNDVERAALHLLSDPVLGAWVQERLDARTRHVLIDEFQDTNPLQWQALSAWLASYAGTGGGSSRPSIFLVGDPKQSIYRFRRAEPQVFIAAKHFVKQELEGDVLSCDHTHRNARPVVEQVNRVMLQAQAQNEFQGFRAHSTESSEAGRVLGLAPIERPQKDKPSKTSAPDSSAGSDDTGQATAWRDSLTTPKEIQEDTLRTLECRQAARWVGQQIAQGVPLGRIMVLARKRDRLSAMQEALRAAHIPAQLAEKIPLGEVPAVQDIVALLDALVSPAHNLSLARALKSPLFSVSDQDLVQLARLQSQSQAADIQEAPSSKITARPWLDLLQHAKDLPAGLANLGAVLTRWQSWLAALPPHDALEAIYEDGDVLARFMAVAPPEQRDSTRLSLQAVLAAALQVDGARYLTPYAFVRALKSPTLLSPTHSNAQAVQLLTVHGAKGLEADVVVLLDTDAPAPNAQTMGVLVDWPGQDKVPRGFVFLASEKNAPLSAQPLLETERQERLREELNALYVAMTRAKYQLVLSSVAPQSSAPSSWWQRLREGCEAVVVASSDSSVVQADDAVVPLMVLPARTAGVAPVVVSATPASLASRIGQAMHRLLEWAPLGAKSVPARDVQRVATAFELDDAQAQQAAQMANTILCGQAAWAWDAQEVVWHGNEVSVVIDGQVRRIDRLVQRSLGEWWVLDYKSALEPHTQVELITQLRSYQQAVQAIYPQQTVRAAFLSAQGTLQALDLMS